MNTARTAIIDKLACQSFEIITIMAADVLT